MKEHELAEAGYEEFGETDTGGGYDWSVFAVWLKDGVFWWASDSGCSCNSSWDFTDFPDDFEGHGNAHDAIKALHSWASGTYSAEGSEGLLTKLLDYKPAHKPLTRVDFEV